MSTNLIGSFSIGMLLVTLFLKSLDRWRNARAISLSSITLLTEALTAITFFIYSFSVDAMGFRIASALILANTAADYFVLQRARRRAVRRELVMASRWSNAPRVPNFN